MCALPRQIDCMHSGLSRWRDGKPGLLTAQNGYCVPREALSSPALERNLRVMAPGLRPLGPSLQTRHSYQWIAPICRARPLLMPAKQSFCTTTRLCSQVLQESCAHQLRLTGAAHTTLRPPAVCAPYCVATSAANASRCGPVCKPRLLEVHVLASAGPVGPDGGWAMYNF